MHNNFCQKTLKVIDEQRKHFVPVFIFPPLILLYCDSFFFCLFWGPIIGDKATLFHLYKMKYFDIKQKQKQNY